MKDCTMITVILIGLGSIVAIAMIAEYKALRNSLGGIAIVGVVLGLWAVMPKIDHATTKELIGSSTAALEWSVIGLIAAALIGLVVWMNK